MSLLASGVALAKPSGVGEATTRDTDKYCIELNGIGLPAGYLNLRKIIAIEDTSASERKNLIFYKAVKSPISDEILYVFSISTVDDVYTVVVMDPKQEVVRRKFTYGSLHYPCQNLRSGA